MVVMLCLYAMLEKFHECRFVTVAWYVPMLTVGTLVSVIINVNSTTKPSYITHHLIRDSVIVQMDFGFHVQSVYAWKVADVIRTLLNFIKLYWRSSPVHALQGPCYK